MLYDCDRTLQLQTNDLDVDAMYEIHVRVKEAARGAVLFISIVTNSTYKLFCDRFLEKLFERLETRNLTLKTRFSILENIEYRGSSFESRLSTCI